MSWNYKLFGQDRIQRLERQTADDGLRKASDTFLKASYRVDYCYQWDWAGLPILQMPEDILTYQEIMFRCKPSFVLETGVAWGGGIALLASVMSLYNPRGQVLGIDLNLDPSLQGRINALKLPVKIHLHRGSSTADTSFSWVRKHISSSDTVMVVLDSHHTHDHVLEELNAYAPLVTPGQFLIVGDTSVKDLATSTERLRPWSASDNPHTALQSFLQSSEDFFQDERANSKLLTSFHPGGYLRKRG